MKALNVSLRDIYTISYQDGRMLAFVSRADLGVNPIIVKVSSDRFLRFTPAPKLLFEECLFWSEGQCKHRGSHGVFRHEKFPVDHIIHPREQTSTSDGRVQRLFNVVKKMDHGVYIWERLCRADVDMDDLLCMDDDYNVHLDMSLDYFKHLRKLCLKAAETAPQC